MATGQELKGCLAHKGDVDSINLMIQKASRWLKTKGIQQWSDSDFTKDLLWEIEKNELFIFKLGERCIGSASLTQQPDGLWADALGKAVYLHRLVIERNWAGRGMGQQIIGWIENKLETSGDMYLRLICDEKNSALQAHYRSLHFTPCGVKHFAPYNMNFVRFEKKLKTS